LSKRGQIYFPLFSVPQFPPEVAQGNGIWRWSVKSVKRL